MKEKLNNTFVNGLTYNDKEYFVWDDELTGFGIKVNKFRKTYFIQG